MSVKKNKSTPTVEVMIPRRGEREDPNLFIGVNGVNYILPRGKRSTVPASVAYEIDRAESARDAIDDYRGSARVQV